MSSVEQVVGYFEKNKKKYLDDLKDLVRIPSISFEGFDPAQVRKSAEKTADLMRTHGLENVQLIDFEGAHPYVYGERLKAPGKPTLLLYAHHDVQPTGKPEVWKSPPFEPTERDGRLYGRGAADDKAGVIVHLASIESYLKTIGELPVNVKILIEGEEEIGSGHLEAFLQSHKKLLAADIMVLTDTANFDVNVPALTVSLRGLVTLNVEARSMKSSLHSGLWGGVLPDPVLALSKILAQLVDDQGRIAVPGLTAKARPLSAELEMQLAKLPYDEKYFREQAGLEADFVGGTSNVYKRMWHEPALAVNAIEASSKKMAANIINNIAWARVGVRIVKDMDPEETAHTLARFIESKAPWGVKVTTTIDSLGGAWFTDPVGPAFDAARAALKKGYGREAVMMGCGASIPFVQPFSDALGGAPALLIGVEDPTTNAHSENESLHIGDWESAIKSSIYLYEEISNRY